MIELLNTLRAPHITETATLLKEASQTLCFRVSREATKVDIRRAVERLFAVKVDSVRVVNMRGKRKRTRNMMGYGFRPSWRKAYVTLKPGQKMVEYFEGV